MCFWQPQEESDKREGAAEHQRAPLVLPPPPPPRGSSAALRASPAAEVWGSGAFRAEPGLSPLPARVPRGQAGRQPTHPPGEGLAACDPRVGVPRRRGGGPRPPGRRLPRRGRASGHTRGRTLKSAGEDGGPAWEAEGRAPGKGAGGISHRGCRSAPSSPLPAQVTSNPGGLR